MSELLKGRGPATGTDCALSTNYDPECRGQRTPFFDGTVQGLGIRLLFPVSFSVSLCVSLAQRACTGASAIIVVAVSLLFYLPPSPVSSSSVSLPCRVRELRFS
jgi:hypothetical protein